MNNFKKTYFFIFICLLFNQYLHAQFNINSYNFTNSIQSNLLNPSIFPSSKATINIPGFYASTFTPKFNLNDIFNKNEDPDSTIRKIIRDPNISFKDISIKSTIDFLLIGFSSKKTYISFGIQSNFNFLGSPPKDIIGLTQGTSYFQNILNRQIDLSNINFNSQLYISYHLGISQQINKNLNIGIRLKYLTGIYDAQINKSTFKVSSNTDSIYIQGNMNAKTAGLAEILKADFNLNKVIYGYYNNNKLPPPNYNYSDNLLKYILDRESAGTGFGVDIGFNLKLNKNFSITASILDIGFINWKLKPQTFNLPTTVFNYKGKDVTDINIDKNLFSNLKDSLTNQVFKPIVKDTSSYKTYLNTKLFAGLQWFINKNNSFDFIFFNDFGLPTFNPTISMAFTKKVLRGLFDIRLSTYFDNYTFNKLGGGFNINLGPIQPYFLTDNIISLFQYGKANYVNIKIGLNINFEKNNKIKKKHSKNKIIKEKDKDKDKDKKTDKENEKDIDKENEKPIEKQEIKENVYN